MSGEEMNIDGGTFMYLFLVAYSPFLFLRVANGGGLVLKRGRVFQSSAGLPCTVLCVRDHHSNSYPSAGNENGVGSEQTYDRVESAPARDFDTRAA